MSAGELLDLDYSAFPSMEPLFEATRENLVGLLKLPRPGCDVCGEMATDAHLDEEGGDAALACKEHEPPGYPVSLDQLADPENDLVSHLGEKNWGLAALMRLMERLKTEETIRQLREARASRGA